MIKKRQLSLALQIQASIVMHKNKSVKRMGSQRRAPTVQY